MRKTVTLCACNKLMGAETLHPLVSVISIEPENCSEMLRTDSYAVLLMSGEAGKTGLGRLACDFTDATMVFRTPNETIPLDHARLYGRSGKLLLFSPELLIDTPLSREIHHFTFMKYSTREALHLSRQELLTIQKCMDDISGELRWGIDKLTAPIICDLITLLLHHCQRCYKRQFITRQTVYEPLISRVQSAIDDYLLTGRMQTEGRPMAGMFAEDEHLSTSYLNDMLREATGKDFEAFLQWRQIEAAKKLIPMFSDEKITQLLGFCSLSCFRTLFRNKTGESTQEYRN